MNPTSKLQHFTLQAEFARRFPDPINQNLENSLPINLEHHILLCPANEIPANLPKDPNPRKQKIDVGIYKEVAKSLEDGDDPTFHLKNKGITILARSVEYSEDKKKLDVVIGPGEGIVDGAHTYEIIRSAIEKGLCPDNQFVKMEIMTGVFPEMALDIARGLNTAVQVQEMALANLGHRFDWIRDILAGKPYLNRIAFMDNEIDKDLDIRDVVSLLTLFNIDLYPDANVHPKKAITAKAECLKDYLEKESSYRKLRPILTDILELHDHVHINAREKYNENRRLEKKKGNAGQMKGVFNTRRKGEYKFPFTGLESQSRLHDGALYPMLGALRYLVARDEATENFVWRVGSLDAVKMLFDSVAAEMVVTIYNTSLTYGRKATSLPKDENLWNTLYKTVALAYFEKYANAEVVSR